MGFRRLPFVVKLLLVARRFGMVPSGARAGDPLRSVALPELPALPASVTELRFREFFKLPVGPRGLEASEKLLSLASKPVRMLGFMVKDPEPNPTHFIFSPVPMSIS